MTKLKVVSTVAIATFTLSLLMSEDASAAWWSLRRRSTPSTPTARTPTPTPAANLPSPVTPPLPCPVSSPPPYVPGIQCTNSSFYYNGQSCPTQICDFPLLNMLYTRLLNRAPDAGGKQYWIGELSKGMTCQQLAKNFVYSAEFQLQQAALSDVDYTIRIYAGLLNRAPDQGGYNYWLGSIQTGYPRNSFAESVILSTEFAGLCRSMGFPAAAVPAGG